eukprot:TRINITY_DN2904_c0_g1_i2.p1 TRINITY_DN2904_c0_g1~~TRINITY_DN2904_c0_g1_i2.p1  ORF type:complete len:144 (-),score=33.80 TRINITY_DN2904_c0_g1_i2:101-532(-)
MTSPNHTEPTRDHQGRDIPEIYELYFHNSIIDILLDSKFKIATIFASFGAMFMGMNYFSRVQKIKAQNAMIARVGFSVIGFVSIVYMGAKNEKRRMKDVKNVNVLKDQMMEMNDEELDILLQKGMEYKSQHRSHKTSYVTKMD